MPYVFNPFTANFDFVPTVTPTAPGGSNAQVQFNDAGAFGGANTFVWDKLNERVGIGTASPTEKLDVNGAIVVPQAAANSFAATNLIFGPRAGNGGGINYQNSAFTLYTSGGAKIILGWGNINQWTSGAVLGWSSGAISGTNDTGLARSAAGIVEVNNGTAGSWAGLRVAAPAAATIGLIVKGAASQSANIFDVQNSSNSTIFSVNKNALRLSYIEDTTPSGDGILNGNQPLIFFSAGARVAAIGTYTYSGIAVATAKHIGFAANTALSGGNFDADVSFVRTSAGVIRLANGSSGYGALLLGAQTTSSIPLTITAAASQSANLTEWKNSSSTVLSSVRPAGLFAAPSGSAGSPSYGFTAGGAGMYLATTNTLGFGAGGGVGMTISSIGGTVTQGQWSGGNFIYKAADAGVGNTNRAGSTLYVKAGEGTGSGAGANLVFSVTKAESSGTSLHTFIDFLTLAATRATFAATRTAGDAPELLIKGKTSTSTRDVAAITSSFISSTDATYAGRLILSTYYASAQQEGIRLDSKSTGLGIGIKGTSFDADTDVTLNSAFGYPLRIIQGSASVKSISFNIDSTDVFLLTYNDDVHEAYITSQNAIGVQSSVFKTYAGTQTTKYATIGGTVANFVETVGNSSTSETDLFSYTVPGNVLGANGHRLEAEYGGSFVSSGTATRQIKIYFGGTAIFDTGALTLSLSSAWTVFVQVQRENSTTVRYMISLTTQGAALAAYTSCGSLAGLTLSSDNILKITGQAAGVGAASNDIQAKVGYVSWYPVGA